MHRVARLKANDALPAALREKLARLRRRVAIAGKGLFLQGQHTDSPPEQDISLLVERSYAWMLLVRGAVDLPGLELFIVRVFLCKRQKRLQRAVISDKRELHAFFERGCLLRRCRERDGDCPGEGIAQVHIVDYAQVIAAGHEARQWTEGTAREHLQVGQLARPYSYRARPLACSSSSRRSVSSAMFVISSPP